MKFKILRAIPQDAGKLSDIMEQVSAGMDHPEWFVKDDLSYITEHIGHIPLRTDDLGFVLKAVVDTDGPEQIAGLFMVAFPELSEKNLGHDISLDEKDLLRVAHMDSVVILPQFRGHGLQYRFLAEAEKVIAAESTYRILLATVHPDNKYSLNNVMAQGYEVAAEALKYGGYRRYIMKKEIGTWQSN